MRRLLSAVALTLATVTLGAQGTAPVIVTLAEQQRQGAFQTGSVTIPVEMTGYIRVLAQISAADHSDPTLSFWVRIYYLDDDTQQWTYKKGMRWMGGTGTVPGQKIGTAIRVYEPDFDNPTQARPGTFDWRGRQVRAEIDIPNRMRIGCIVDNPQNPITE